MNITSDFHIYETGSGGDLVITNNDLSMSESLFQTIYIALFGGNYDAITLGNEEDSEERLDFWANELLFKEKPSKQFNSTTEKLLNEVVINSQGRIKIQRAVEFDLIFLKKIANLEVNIVILSIEKIAIQISFSSIINQKDFEFIWDNASKEVTINKTI